MGVNLRGKSFLKLLDFSSQEIRYLLDLSKNFKNMKMNGVDHNHPMEMLWEDINKR